ncbi:PAS domain-containing protein [Alkalilimnicola ehrlichii MLHE-1]|uniref:Putative PAS/PAC sensor protein n=1 Tax=Alkalilimnicola ehrlichii (strain ATCC BAA-1101 / DSM 17681 / MLHE-1) TaxID=187272 RepID=Q0A9L8_ALKEH|nr:PAS domain-containing protein [Alkalilimnicola ehrlichii]ABI56469.1 putative PAS/PAC sensor protein [Alkalilimnicola ehrlichii MLHE-1]
MSGDLSEEGRLRLAAERKLASGTAPPANGWTVSVDALGMLYRLASAPGSADEALKLLHELQVHQVELDLQQEQLVAAEREAEAALNRYQTLYEYAPVAYFVVDHSGTIMDVNRAGAGQVGGCPIGRAFSEVLASESRPAVQDLFAALGEEGDEATCRVRLAQDEGPVNLVAAVAPGGDLVLITVSNESGSRES